jgi:transcriptional regulator with XRE-family HTH domain
MKIGQKMRRLRKLKGLTIEELSDHADLTKGFISQVERDKAVPTITTLKQILDVLGVELTTFFSEFEEREKNIYLQNERIVEKNSKNFKIEQLVPKLKYLEMEPVVITISPLSIFTKNFEEDEGFGFVAKGRLKLAIDKEERVVQKGDCFYIFFDSKISMENLTNRAAEVLLVNY